MNMPVKEMLFGDLWEYAPALESTGHAQFEKRYGHFIDGEFVDASSYMKSVNPATEEVLFEFGVGTEADVDRAVQAARRAFEGPWGKMGGRERSKYIYRIARMIQEKARELAILETLDGGKPIKESRDVDIPLAAAHFFYYAGWADKLEYAFPGTTPRPLGVAGQVIPWNFPLLMAAWKIAPALATGNTVVLKAAETTPLTAMKLAEIIQEAGLPPGVVNLVNGAGATGAAIVFARDVAIEPHGRARLGAARTRRALVEYYGRTSRHRTATGAALVITRDVVIEPQGRARLGAARIRHGLVEHYGRYMRDAK